MAATVGGPDSRSRPSPASLAGEPVRGDSTARRIVDVVVAAIALVGLSPILALAALAVKLDSKGSVIFRQDRVGRDGRLFTLLKLRSMVSDAERFGPAVNGPDDARITHAGAFLRATSLDELPQLVNVLTGDMTLIGARPEVPRYVEYYTPEECQILSVRPGLTGPGQLFFRAAEIGPSDPEREYVEHQLHPKLARDLAYLRSRSLRDDLAIVGQTVGSVARGLLHRRPRRRHAVHGVAAVGHVEPANAAALDDGMREREAK